MYTAMYTARQNIGRTETAYQEALQMMALPLEVNSGQRGYTPLDGSVSAKHRGGQEDGGALLLREADRKMGLLKRVVRCFTDARDPEHIEHLLGGILAQRVYGLALGYEDLNDHEELRRDPLLAGKRDLEEPLAGQEYIEPAGAHSGGCAAGEDITQIKSQAFPKVAFWLGGIRGAEKL